MLRSAQIRVFIAGVSRGKRGNIAIEATNGANYGNSALPTFHFSFTACIADWALETAPKPAPIMHLMYYLDAEGKRVYTLKVCWLQAGDDALG